MLGFSPTGSEPVAALLSAPAAPGGAEPLPPAPKLTGTVEFRTFNPQPLRVFRLA